ncbi:uncharacterized protein LOC107858361 [Capsicum annuum]|uniref:uncharacterized protein LOC107858361 n=1 Tax=Capsicum annuum TaxID=4072 RepID=UPI001FB0AA4A|nr:uncharacterized protein LOC107858361 [Capsicum annuum]
MRVEGKYLVHVAVFHPQFIVCHFSPSSHTVQTPLQSDNFPQLTAHFSFLSLRQFRPASGRPFRVTNIVWSKSWGSQIHQYLYYRSVNPPPRFGYSSGRVDDSDVSSSSGNSLQPLYITLPNLLQKPWKALSLFIEFLKLNFSCNHGIHGIPTTWQHVPDKPNPNDVSTRKAFPKEESATHSSFGQSHFVCSQAVLPFKESLGEGWHEVCVDNDLKEGDFIKFEVVTNKEKPIWKFHEGKPPADEPPILPPLPLVLKNEKRKAPYVTPQSKKFEYRDWDCDRECDRDYDLMHPPGSHKKDFAAPVDVEQPIDSNEPTYCVCNQAKFLKVCGTLTDTPTEIRNCSMKCKNHLATMKEVDPLKFSS